LTASAAAMVSGATHSRRAQDTSLRTGAAALVAAIVFIFGHSMTGQAWKILGSAGTLCRMPAQKRLAVGDRAPMFTLPSSTGQPVALADQLAHGPVVIGWYLFDFGRV
jgi:hypothetical protein